MATCCCGSSPPRYPSRGVVLLFLALANLLIAAHALQPTGLAQVELRHIRSIWNFREPPSEDGGVPVSMAFRSSVFAIISVEFDGDIYAGSHFADARATNVTAPSDGRFAGSVRLLCGRTLFESDDVLDSGKQVFTGFAPKLLEKEPMLRAALDADLFAQRSKFVALLPLDAEGANSDMQQLRNGLSWSKCRLRFLAADDQLRSFNKSVCVTDAQGQPYVGSVGFNASIAKDGALSSSDSAQEHELWGMLHLRDSLRPQDDEKTSLKPTDDNSTANRFLQDPYSNPHLLSLIQSDEQLSVGFEGIIKGIVGPAVEPMAQPIGDGVGAIAGPPISGSVTPHLTTTVSDQVGAVIGPAIINPVLAELPPALAETVSEALTAGLQKRVSRDVTAGIYPVVTERVTVSLSAKVSVDISKTVDEGAPEKIANDLVPSLGVLLSHAASSAIVGALTHTITHSPMMDYYCFYCSEYNLYCSYCQLSPHRLYYSMYYVNYFSMYYAPYYATYFSTPGYPDWVGTKYPDMTIHRSAK